MKVDGKPEINIPEPRNLPGSCAPLFVPLQNWKSRERHDAAYMQHYAFVPSSFRVYTLGSTAKEECPGADFERVQTWDAALERARAHCQAHHKHKGESPDNLRPQLGTVYESEAHAAAAARLLGLSVESDDADAFFCSGSGRENATADGGCENATAAAAHSPTPAPVAHERAAPTLRPQMRAKPLAPTTGAATRSRTSASAVRERAASAYRPQTRASAVASSSSSISTASSLSASSLPASSHGARPESESASATFSTTSSLQGAGFFISGSTGVVYTSAAQALLEASRTHGSVRPATLNEAVESLNLSAHVGSRQDGGGHGSSMPRGGKRPR
ncbi:hypothetical protein GGX14DRAFT_571419 [Mycena pura]|uniref:Uncharacterized protein n=1 Tax=Mycena pura TaxID=153505 RepID=A0AAD6V5D7_9AGAR|nr:hypothetical protein GGX14DRAFT_571419 [Mycena pura]